MARTKIEMKGLESVIKDLNKLGKSISTPIKTGMTKATNKCKRLAKEECPTNKDLKITGGSLKESIHSEVRSKAEQIVGEVSTNKEYAAYVEFGTGQRGMATNTNTEVEVSYRADWAGQKAHPYMYPAFTQTKEELPKFLKNEMDKVLRGRRN